MHPKTHTKPAKGVSTDTLRKYARASRSKGIIPKQFYDEEAEESAEWRAHERMSKLQEVRFDTLFQVKKRLFSDVKEFSKRSSQMAELRASELDRKLDALVERAESLLDYDLQFARVFKSEMPTKEKSMIAKRIAGLKKVPAEVAVAKKDVKAGVSKAKKRK